MSKDQKVRYLASRQWTRVHGHKNLYRNRKTGLVLSFGSAVRHQLTQDLGDREPS
jgi:hypothetical protein